MNFWKFKCSSVLTQHNFKMFHKRAGNENRKKVPFIVKCCSVNTKMYLMKEVLKDIIKIYQFKSVEIKFELWKNWHHYNFIVFYRCFMYVNNNIIVHPAVAPFRFFHWFDCSVLTYHPVYLGVDKNQKMNRKTR